MQLKDFKERNAHAKQVLVVYKLLLIKPGTGVSINTFIPTFASQTPSWSQQVVPARALCSKMSKRSCDTVIEG